MSSFQHSSIHHTSKTLNKADISGEILTSKLFPDEYQPYFLDFEKIQYDPTKNSWIFIDHILLEQPISSYDDLSDITKTKIETLFAFSYLLKEQSGKNVDVLISFYFSKESPHTDIVQRLHPDNFQIFNVTTSQYANVFKNINARSGKGNHNFDLYSNENIWNLRVDDSPFSFSKACLGNEFTNGFNIDKILFFPEINKCALFEYLLCESSQRVNPYTSHPNKYHNKNSNKFKSLWEFSQNLNSPVYMLNYAKEGEHLDKVKFMKFIQYNPQNLQKPVTTQDKNTTISLLRTSIEHRFSPVIRKPHF